MAASQSPLAKNSQILIVGAGVFGLSTAFHLAQQGYKNIKVLDREDIPSPYSAGHDLNKIIRAEYEDPFYTEIALVSDFYDNELPKSMSTNDIQSSRKRYQNGSLLFGLLSIALQAT